MGMENNTITIRPVTTKTCHFKAHCYNKHNDNNGEGFMAWALAPRQNKHGLERSDIPQQVELPLLRNTVGDRWVWAASALMPEGETAESLQFWRKRFRQSRADLSTGSPVLTNGTYRDWQMPVPLLLCRRMVAYANGGRSECKKVLRELRYLGKKRAHGHGKIVAMHFDEADADYTMHKDGVTTRWLPDEHGTRLVRCIPPYWHPHNRVRCSEVGHEQR